MPPQRADAQAVQVQAIAAQRRGHGLGHVVERRCELSRPSEDDAAGFGLRITCGPHGYAGSQDARFLSRDLRHGRAQHFRVIDG